MIIESLHIYPVKALAGISLQEAEVTPRGLKYDRRFMLVTDDDRFITQRTHPQLTQFGVEIMGNDLMISHPESGRVQTSLTPASEPSGRATVWNDEVLVSKVRKEVDRFFSKALGESIRMVGMPDCSVRQVDLQYGEPGELVSFADGYPVLVLGRASIEELNTRLDNPVPIKRFRANIIVSGSGAWEEDSWKEVSAERVVLKMAKQCARCIVIRTDQQTGERSDEPMTTLLTYRRFDKKVMVGMNAIPDRGSEGLVLKVGQTIAAN